MTTKHTPGPWITDQGVPYVDKRLFNVWDIEGNVITRVYGKVADARLITAAPELLDALIVALAVLQKDLAGQVKYGPKAISLARAAVAKAEGR